MAVLHDESEGGVRRLATVLVTPKLLLGMLQGDGSRAVRFGGIPEDARLVGAQLNDDIPAFVLVLEHEGFPKVLDGIMPMPLNVDQVSVDLCDRCLSRFDGVAYRGPRGINYTVFAPARLESRNRVPVGSTFHCPMCGTEISTLPCRSCGHERTA